jgi:hypothetical protein
MASLKNAMKINQLFIKISRENSTIYEQSRSIPCPYLFVEFRLPIRIKLCRLARVADKLHISNGESQTPTEKKKMTGLAP